jgi:hypothetical protein
MKARAEGYTSTLSLTSALYGIEWAKPLPGSCTPGGCSPTGARTPDRQARSVSLYRGCHVTMKFRASGVCSCWAPIEGVGESNAEWNSTNVCMYCAYSVRADVDIHTTVVSTCDCSIDDLRQQLVNSPFQVKSVLPQNVQFVLCVIIKYTTKK